jgi:tetratricopeptide (TPR) repeat protein
VPDLNALAADLAVDVVLTGSMLRVQNRMRVSAELVSVPAGDVWWSQTTQVAVDSVLDLHDDLARRVVASLPLTAQDQARTPQARAASAKAFDLYLRGMQLRSESSGWHQAHSFFEQCLSLDPSFAPAWAERGRLERLIGKYEEPSKYADAESTLLHALELDPNDGAAQYYYAQLEIELGRLQNALRRLLERVRQRRAEPHVYAALVHACRYAGLLEESVAAHHLARRLDPTVATSVHHTYYMQGDFPRALDEAHHSNDPVEAWILWALGRRDEALAATHREESRFAASSVLSSFTTGLRAAIEGRPDAALAALEPFETIGSSDGESLFYVGGIYATTGYPEKAYAALTRSIDTGFLCLPAFERVDYLAPLRGMETWRSLMGRLKPRHRFVVEEFMRTGGRALLGL